MSTIHKNDFPRTQNIKAVLRYNGEGFHGWQFQPGLRTVQGVIQDALAMLARQPVTVQGSGRTDAGVHALGQVMSFLWWEDEDFELLRRAMSGILKPEIRIDSLEPASPEFNAQFSATGKRYAYAITTAGEPDPWAGKFAWRIRKGVDMDRLRALLPRLTGTHDFAGFQGGNASPKASTVRTIHSITLSQGGILTPCADEEQWRLDFHGNGFLYKMVRNITGTLVDVSRGHVPERRIEELLQSPGPYHGHSAPPHGLALVTVEYGTG
ncbi:MAG: tRNA pseudouridine synthase A [Candidatus Hydrogenedentota bacterium]